MMEREMPQAIREGAAPPPTWTRSAEEWAARAAEARDVWHRIPKLDFALDVGERGYYPDELETGRMRPGAEINALTGRVQRSPLSTISAAEGEEARQALHALARAHMQIDTVLQLNLESAAYGRWQGQPKAVAAAIKVASSALASREAELRRAAEAEAAMPILRVRVPFQAKGRSYSPGEYHISQQEAAALRDWRQKKEAQAKLRDWDSPDGFSPTSWPPFEIF